METLWYLLGILILILGLAISIGIHEFGHLIPAKKFGVRVPHWAIGFGPKLFSKKFGETEYSIRLIPLGGFITLIGMFPPARDGKDDSKRWFSRSIMSARNAHSEHEQPGDENRKFYQLSAWKRIVVMFGGPVTNFILGTLLIVLAYSAIGVPQRVNTVQKVVGCESQMLDTAAICKATEPSSPAKAAGLLPGDQIIRVNSETVSPTQDLKPMLESAKPVVLSVVRDGKTLEITVVPALADLPYLVNGQWATDANGTPLLKQRPYIGVSWEQQRIGVGVDKSFAYAMTVTGDTFSMLVKFPQQVYSALESAVTGTPRDPNSVVSIVGVGQAAGELTANSSIDIVDRLVMNLNLLGALNLALFAFNMIPLPPLDGGHIAGALYEYVKRGFYRIAGIRKRATVDTALMAPVATTVFVLLLFAGLAMMLVDIVNPIKF
jgi:membrane-associated protease RseP (regulator of RpoE activity)